jgi:6-phosphofructokinase 1
MRKKRIGILTGGGDAPGLNPAIRAVTKKASKLGYEVIGIKNGWKGLLENQIEKLDEFKTSGIIDKGGTILGGDALRTNPFKVEKGPEKIFDNFKKLGLTALIAIGGEDTLGVAYKFYKMGLPVVGIPKTIDNDVRGTDYTIGFQTAVQVATEALDRLRTTAESHHQVMILEVMGRYAGWIATYAGLANGADAILIPEVLVNLDILCEMVKNRRQVGKNFTIIVVAEGVNFGEIKEAKTDDFDHIELRKKHVGIYLEDVIIKRTGLEARASILGRIQRGGSPCAYDRNLALSFGVKAVELVNTKQYGKMVALKGNTMTAVPLKIAGSGIKTVPLSIYQIAETFFG